MGHHHHHVDPEAADSRIFWAVIVNLGLTIAQMIGGVLAGSLALIADALHNFSDAISLVIAFAARKIARRPVDETMTFGYGRAEVVAALVNYTTLIVLGLYLAYEAILRLIAPEAVDGWLVVVIAALALTIDLITAALTFSMSKSSVNIRAAFLHNVADALGSVAVIFAGTLILLYDWRLIDPAVTLLIAGYILWQSFSEIRRVIHILMLGVPEDVGTLEAMRAMKRLKGVSDVHHLHVWQMQEHETSLEAHVVIDVAHWDEVHDIKAALKAKLADRFGINHVTLEMECDGKGCDNAQIIGHDQATGYTRHDHGHEH